MRHRNRLAPACALALLASVAAPSQAARSTVVVELFTSQGCSSCPPADTLLSELADERGVIPLSLHVDYWDDLGWKDPFSNAAYTRRQRRYARSLQASSGSTIYTPQMVIDGRAGMVGSAEGQVRRAIHRARGGDAVVPRFVGQGAPTAVRLPAAADTDRATVWLASYDRHHTTPVKRGENSGRTLTNDYVVRSLQRLGSWNGEARAFAIDAAGARSQGHDGLVVLVQRPGQGPILGAARHVFASDSAEAE